MLFNYLRATNREEKKDTSEIEDEKNISFRTLKGAREAGADDREY